MSREINVQSFESFRYRELYKITQWKDGCIWKTKPIGFIRKEHEALLSTERFVTASISTSLQREPSFVIDVLTKEEVEELANSASIDEEVNS